MMHCAMHRYFQQLIDGVQYCHQKGITHGALKMEHLLLDGRAYSPDLKIAGFGYFNPTNYQPHRGRRQCIPACVLPEFPLSNAIPSSRADGQAMDVWACGVILFKMLNGTFPCVTNPNVHRTKQILTEYLQKASVPSAACGLIEMMSNPDPKQRASLEQIQEHKWVMVAQPPRRCHSQLQPVHSRPKR